MATSNDDFANAALVYIDHDGGDYVSGLLDLTQNTVEPGESASYSSTRTAWWRYTPSLAGTVKITATTGHPDYSLIDLRIWTGTAFDSLSYRGSHFASGEFSFSVTAGVTYYIQACAFYGVYVDGFVETGGLPGDYLYDKEAEGAPVTLQFVLTGQSTTEVPLAVTQQPLLYAELGDGLEAVPSSTVPENTWVELLATADANGSFATTAQWQTEVSGSWQDIPGATYASTSFDARTVQSVYAPEIVHRADNGKRFRVRFTRRSLSTYSDPLTLTVTYDAAPELPKIQARMQDGTWRGIGTHDSPIRLKAFSGDWITFNNGGGVPLRVRMKTGEWYVVSTGDH